MRKTRKLKKNQADMTTDNDAPENHIFRSPKFKSVVDDAVDFINKTDCGAFPPGEKFIGGGVYILYYCGGSYKLYHKISNMNLQCIMPIYIGKAVPPGWRTARIRNDQAGTLYQRLNQHARSIDKAENLVKSEFKCRYMILRNSETDLIGAVEAELIRRYKPLWNTVVDGFGNHDPGKGRYNQAKSEWDVLHPGREWAYKCKGRASSMDDVRQKVHQYIASR